MEANWRDLHGNTIRNFLHDLNHDTQHFILKGGTALAQCYNLDRFSEDIDLDAEKENIISHVKKFCNKYGYEYRIAKDTVTVKRCFINYGDQEKPLKIEVSYRNQHIADADIRTINGITVYSIDRLAQMKASAYNARDKIRDLYDVAFITNTYFDKLQQGTMNTISDALLYKGMEQFDYIVKTQHDELIDVEKLADSFLKMYDRLGLLCDDAKELSPKEKLQKEMLTKSNALNLKK
jgi:predicted nucleotidyltransferase component of viral defense system